VNAPLTPVDFKKGREHLPRLSEPYVPGKRHARYWTAEEEAIVREYYPAGGVSACQAHLQPHRTRAAIHAYAHSLGIRSERMPERRKARPKYALDDIVRERWPLLNGRGAVALLAEELSIPRWQLSRTASRLGLAIPHKKEPQWTAAEENLLRKVPLHSPHQCARIFAEHGFARTPTSIIIRAKRIGLSRRQTAKRDGFTGMSAARGARWHITREDLRQFVLDNLARIDFRKVDKFELVDLLVNRPLPRNPNEMG
jgi:hypothetical protein